MKPLKNAVITGADGGMGFEITKAVARAGYNVIMACYDLARAEDKKQRILEEQPDADIEIIHIDLSSLESVAGFADKLLERGAPVNLLMNNAGTMATCYEQTVDGLEKTVCVNYAGHYLLTRKLIPLMPEGARIANMVSCTYAVGKLSFPRFFTHGKKGSFWRIPIYSNSKLAFLLFTYELAERLKDKGITVNAADPGIVSTDIITMDKWFDPLADIFFRPIIRTPLKGASTAIGLLLDDRYAGCTGKLCASNRIKKVSRKYPAHPMRKQLWDETERVVERYLAPVSEPI